MALVNDVKKEINAKIVYVGPKGSGKTTALRHIYEKIKPEYRSELKCTPLGDHQLFFFDFAYPQQARADGYSVRFHLYTVQIGSGAAPPWKMLLKGADGVVFLADSAAGRLEDNIACGALLYEALAQYGISPGDVPLSIQCNKTDLQETVPAAQIAAETFPELAGSALPVSALSGEGLLEGLQKVVRSILQNTGRAETSLVEPVNEGLAMIDTPAPDNDLAGVGGSSADGFRVEPAGKPVMLDSGVLSLPLKLLDANGSCRAEFALGITITNRELPDVSGI